MSCIVSSVVQSSLDCRNLSCYAILLPISFCFAYDCISILITSSSHIWVWNQASRLLFSSLSRIIWAQYIVVQSSLDCGSLPVYILPPILVHFNLVSILFSDLSPISLFVLCSIISFFVCVGSFVHGCQILVSSSYFPIRLYPVSFSCPCVINLNVSHCCFILKKGGV